MPLEELKANEKDVSGSQQVAVADDVAYTADGLLVERKDTHRGLKPRHVQLIAISGAIGTGLFASRHLTGRRNLADDADWIWLGSQARWALGTYPRLLDLWCPCPRIFQCNVGLN